LNTGFSLLSSQSAISNGHTHTRTHTDAAAMSADDVVCTGWLIKSPPEKKLKRFVSESPVSECDVFSIRSGYCSIMIHCQFMFSVYL